MREMWRMHPIPLIHSLFGNWHYFLAGRGRDSVGCIQSPLSLLVLVNFIKVKHTVKDTNPCFSFLKLVFLVIKVKVIKSEKTYKQKNPNHLEITTIKV